MNKEKHFDGIARISKGCDIPFHYECGILKLFIGDIPCTLDSGSYTVIGQKQGMLAGGYLLFHLSLPLVNLGMITCVDITETVPHQPKPFGTLSLHIDYYIDGYEDNVKISQIRFQFPELDYFIPSARMCLVSNTKDSGKFLRTVEIIKSFIFTYQEHKITFEFLLYSTVRLGMKCSAETMSELKLSFDETDDMKFILETYHLINDFFSFLCNRQNIALDSAVLVGKSIHKKITDCDGKKEIINIPTLFSATLVVINKYKEEQENENRISKTIPYTLIESAFENLFSLFVDNKISIFSVHSSLSARNLLDLKQCLQITAAFEYYHRTFLPEISSETTLQVYDEIIELIKIYSDKLSGKKKKKAANLLKSLSPNISLQEKICKVYHGYDGWRGVNIILTKHFGDDVTELAEKANIWRNELAHEKREYEPDQQVISAIRLVEHLNYCIVLREAGYSDDKIMAIVENVLTR